MATRLSHASTVRYQPPAGKRQTLVSACVRLHQMFGESVSTWENRMSGANSDYCRVSRMNLVLLSLGMADKVSELMAPVDHSMGSQVVPPLFEALSDAQLADCFEDSAEEPFREKLRREVATVEDAETYLKRSAAARHKAELAEIAVRTWISERQEQK